MGPFPRAKHPLPLPALPLPPLSPSPVPYYNPSPLLLRFVPFVISSRRSSPRSSSPLTSTSTNLCLSISPNNAPLRAHENTLNGLLEFLDAIESDGDEEVRNIRREVVREVEKALEDLERRVSEKAFELQVIKDAGAKVYGAEALACPRRRTS
ncbi:hypothetical protein EDB89DRAFT_26175 [Lactarius sanguifluus]|nr:hypothetical protein EDB89DRAFT_26175 [Lactarius sanguifluus]